MNDVRGAIAVWRLQLVPDVTDWRQRQAPPGYRRTADIAAQSLQLVTLIGPRSHASMQGKARDLTRFVVGKVLIGRQRLQGNHLAPLLRPNRHAPGDRGSLQLRQWASINLIANQVAVLGIPFQSSPAFQAPTDT